MPAIRVNVNSNPIPWILITRAGSYPIDFFNDNPTHDKTVVFDDGNAPLDIAALFTVENGGGSEPYTLSAAAANGKYPYRVHNGGSRNGGIEIRR